MENIEIRLDPCFWALQFVGRSAARRRVVLDTLRKFCELNVGPFGGDRYLRNTCSIHISHGRIGEDPGVAMDAEDLTQIFFNAVRKLTGFQRVRLGVNFLRGIHKYAKDVDYSNDKQPRTLQLQSKALEPYLGMSSGMHIDDGDGCQYGSLGAGFRPSHNEEASSFQRLHS